MSNIYSKKKGYYGLILEQVTMNYNCALKQHIEIKGTMNTSLDIWSLIKKSAKSKIFIC